MATVAMSAAPVSRSRERRAIPVSNLEGRVTVADLPVAKALVMYAVKTELVMRTVVPVKVVTPKS